MPPAPAALDSAFAALADPVRREILTRLKAGEASAGELAAPFAISQPAVSRHLRVLREAGLVVQRRQGAHRLFRLAPRPLAEIDAFLDGFRAALAASYDRLDALTRPEDGP